MAEVQEETAFIKFRKRMFKENSSERIEHQIPSFWAPIILIAGILIFVGMYYNFKALPTPLLIRDEAQNPGRFIAERAENYLRPLESFGPKIVGTEANEVLAVQYLLKELKNIQDLNLNSTYHFLEIDLQIATGSFLLEFKPYGLASYYQGIQNVIAKISPKKAAATHSLLVNCHFDSVPISPGGADDGVNCAVMLEIIRVLASSDVILKHNVIFLFNGAEENTLQGAHAFITQHEWANEVKALINLEAAGSGGKEIMFQTGPENPWLVQHYARVAPHPSGQTMGEELFQSGLIPSDTDFRIFRDFRNIVGADFAHAENGYIYHTKFDSMKYISLGTYQHTGDNILAYVKALATADEIYNIKDNADGHMIFFDFCSWFMITYTETVGIILNCILSAFALLTLGLSYRSMQKFNDVSAKDICIEIIWSLQAQLLGWKIAMGSVILIGIVVDAAGRPLSWYTSTWLLSGVYYLPTFLGLAVPTVVLIVHKKSVLPLSHRVQMVCHANCLILIIFIIILTGLRIRSAYVLLVVIVPYETATIVNVLTGLQNKVNSWLYVHLAGQIIPLMFIMTMALVMENTIVPISGRGGPASNPELLVAVATVFMGLLLGGFIMPLIGLLRSPRLVICGMASIIIVFFIFVATPIGFPYGADNDRPTPQRYWAFHSKRILHNEAGEVRRQDSGVFLLAMDRNSPKFIQEHVPEMKDAFSTADWCEEELYCGIPFYTSRMHGQAKYSHWVPLGEPDVMKTEAAVILQLVSSQEIKVNVKRFNFKLSGPDHMGIYISPYSKASLVGWDLVDTFKAIGPLWGDRETYFIFYSYATDNRPLSFYIDIQTPATWTGPRMDIAVTSHYLHHDNKQTAGFKNFLKSFPEWTHVTPWMSTYEGWKY